MRWLILTACAGLCAGGLVVAQESPGLPAQGAQPPGRTPEEVFPQSDHDLLRGPGVELLEGLTLVRRDAEGRLVRPDATVEEAAVDLLRGMLDEEARRRVDEVLATRSGEWDAFFRENVKEIIQLQSDLAAGPQGRASAMETLRELSKEAPSLEDHRVFRDELAGALPEEARAKFEEITREYREALLEEVRGEAEKRGVSLRRAVQEEMVRAFGGEVRRAYERETTLGKERLEETIAALNLTPEQEPRVRNAIQTFGQKQRLGTASAADRRELFRTLAGVLNEEQLRTLLSFVRGRKG